MRSFLPFLLLPLYTLASPFASAPNAIQKRAVHVDIEVSEGTANPDGMKERMVYLLNGNFPADQLDLEEGDDVELVMKNSASEAITIHFHGIEQTGTPWSDGVPGVTQDATEPGDTFTYRFTVNQHGFFHAHAHRKEQQDDGLYFPISVKPKSGRENPFEAIAQAAAADDVNAAVDAMVAAELSPHSITLVDWRHRTSEDLVNVWQQSRIEPLCVDSILINGKGSSVCPPADELASLATARNNGDLTAKGCLTPDNPLMNPGGAGFNGDPSQVPDDMWKDCDSSAVNNELARITLTDDDMKRGWAALQFVNAGGLWEEAFSVDEHPMYVFAVEGQYISTTAPVQIVSVPSGQRFQVFVKLDKAAGSAFTIRVAANGLPQVISGYAILEYGTSDGNLTAPAEGYPPLPASEAYMRYNATGVSDDVKTFEPLTQGAPYPANPPPQTSNGTIFLEMTRPNATIWAANHTGLPSDIFEDLSPLIWDTVWPDVEEAVVNGTGPLVNSTLVQSDSLGFVDLGTTLDIVLTTTGATQPPHPMHKHFNKFWVVGQGNGAFSWSSVDEASKASPSSFNLDNPPYRDGFNTLPGEGWMVLRYTITDPGPDVLHCHLSQHITGGMTYVILSGMDQLKVPDEYGPH